MAGVLKGLKVLDLTSGVAGPMAAMLLGDNGADVIKIEPPGGDPARHQPELKLGYKVWQRGKRSAFLDLHNADDRATLHALVRGADILIESFAPGDAAKHGADYAASPVTVATMP
jgi:crotonobetainyl-CoA:carnitine CoA-transferase CaiB-like acyl-CoA transferase